MQNRNFAISLCYVAGFIKKTKNNPFKLKNI